MDPVAALDQSLSQQAELLGDDYRRYRNHCQRLLALILRRRHCSLDECGDLVVALTCHDLGIWTDHTLDYLAPSARLGEAEAERGDSLQAQRIVDLIQWHHKITPFRGADAGLVNALRRADWFDVVFGAVARWSPNPELREIYRRFPTLGFHWMLFRLVLRRLRQKPWSPLPMFRW